MTQDTAKLREEAMQALLLCAQRLCDGNQPDMFVLEEALIALQQSSGDKNSRERLGELIREIQANKGVDDHRFDMKRIRDTISLTR